MDQGFRHVHRATSSCADTFECWRPACPLCRRVSYTQERHMFHVLISDGITYLAVAEEVGLRPQQLPASFPRNTRT